MLHELLVFYLLFEVLLLLIFTTVATYWYNLRAVYAVYMLVAYTVVGSACMGASMVTYYVLHGSLHTLGGIDIATTYTNSKRYRSMTPST